MLWGAPIHKVLWSRDFERSCDKQTSLYIHKQSVYGYKIGRMITYLDELLPTKVEAPPTASSYRSVYDGHETC